MYKLVTLGVLVAALAVPAGAVAKRSPQPRVQVSCSQRAVYRPGRNYRICDGGFWIRDVETGQVLRVPFWKLQQPNPMDPNRP